MWTKKESWQAVWGTGKSIEKQISQIKAPLKLRRAVCCEADTLSRGVVRRQRTRTVLNGKPLSYAVYPVQFYKLIPFNDVLHLVQQRAVRFGTAVSGPGYIQHKCSGTAFAYPKPISAAVIRVMDIITVK